MIKRFMNDSFKSIFSNILYLAIIQFYLFPLLSNQNSLENFGYILTTYSLMTFFSVIIGNTLNNIRLLNNDRLKNNEFNMKFLTLILLSVSISSILFTLIISMSFNYEAIAILSLAITMILMSFRCYLVVYFRLNLDFNKLVYVSLIQFAIIILSSIIFNSWIFILLFSELFAIIYILQFLKTKNIEVTFSKDKKLNIEKDYLNLLGINFLNNLVVYFDRFFIVIVLGAKSVSIIFITLFFGKIIIGLVAPINSVTLSYLSVNKNMNTRKVFLISIMLSLIVGLLIFLLSYPSVFLLTKYIYNVDFLLVKDYILIGNLAVSLHVMGDIIFPLLIKYSSISRQTKIQIVYFITYFISVVILTITMGLIGFFIGVLLSEVLRTVLMTIVGYRYVANNINNLEV